MLYKVWKEKERIGKMCDVVYSGGNGGEGEKEKGEGGNGEDVMGGRGFVYVEENGGKRVGG